MKYYYQNVKNGPNKRRRISICEWVYFDIRFWQTKVRPVCMDHHYYDYYDDDGKWYQAMIFLLQKKVSHLERKKNSFIQFVMTYSMCVCVCLWVYIIYTTKNIFKDVRFYFQFHFHIFWHFVCLLEFWFFSFSSFEQRILIANEFFFVYFFFAMKIHSMNSQWSSFFLGNFLLDKNIFGFFGVFFTPSLFIQQRNNNW